MVKYSENTMLGLKALQRAADKVFEIARKNMVVNQLRPNKINEEKILQIFEEL